MGEPTDVMRAKYAATNAKDPEKMLSCYSPDVAKEVPGGILHGPDQIVAFVSAFWEAFPDIRLTVISEVEDGPVVAIRVRMTGTHTGTFRTPGGDLPATGRRVDLMFSDDFRVEGGLIVSSHLYLDRLTLLEQLGAVPAPAAT